MNYIKREGLVEHKHEFPIAACPTIGLRMGAELEISGFEISEEGKEERRR